MEIKEIEMNKGKKLGIKCQWRKTKHPKLGLNTKPKIIHFCFCYIAQNEICVFLFYTCESWKMVKCNEPAHTHQRHYHVLPSIAIAL